MNPHALPTGHSFWTPNPFAAMSVAVKLGGLPVDRYYSGQYMHGMIDSGHGWFGYGIRAPRGGFLIIDWIGRELSYRDDPGRIPPAFKFNVGDRVVYTNEYGVCFGLKTIIEQVAWPTTRDDNGPTEPRYHHEGSDTPWLPKQEARYTLADQEDLDAEDWLGDLDHYQTKYGFKSTKEQRAALLDNDPFDGEA